MMIMRGAGLGGVEKIRGSVLDKLGMKCLWVIQVEMWTRQWVSQSGIQGVARYIDWGLLIYRLYLKRKDWKKSPREQKHSKDWTLGVSSIERSKELGRCRGNKMVISKWSSENDVLKVKGRKHFLKERVIVKYCQEADGDHIEISFRGSRENWGRGRRESSDKQLLRNFAGKVIRWVTRWRNIWVKAMFWNWN